MGLRYGVAKATARVLHWGLTHVARRPGANLPGKVALMLDPQAIEHARGALRCGAIMVTGTNGKTTVNNLLADCVERSGASVCCNRTGANLAYGVASALLECRGADWGIIESDELWLGRSLPALQPRYLVLLNLFRDQLDRCGEIDHIQDVIVEALRKSPDTGLIYNADDPLCAMVAERAAALPGREGAPSVAFGVAAPMNLEQNVVSDTTMCQRCNAMLEYEWRQYGQLGAYRCPECGFARPALDFAATDVRFTPSGLDFDVSRETIGALEAVERRSCDSEAGRSVKPALHRVGFSEAENVSRETFPTESAAPNSDTKASSNNTQPNDVSRETIGARFAVHSHLAGSYMVYNLLAVATAALCAGCTPQDVQDAIDAFDPQNGRLQEFRVGQHRTLLNLAKNPTGFNQNLRIVVQQAMADASPDCAIAFFINDRDVDGHDISWIWDIDFEELGRLPQARVFAGGTRKHDLQVRLKYAGVDAQLIDGMEDVFAAVAHDGLPTNTDVYAIANYTALAPVHTELDALQKDTPSASPSGASTVTAADSVATESSSTESVEIVSRETFESQDDVKDVLHDVENVSRETLTADMHRQNAHQNDTLNRDVSHEAFERSASGVNVNQSLYVTENVPRETYAHSAVDENVKQTLRVAEDVSRETSESAEAAGEREPVVIAHMFPDLLNLYGDGGNVRILQQRLRWRGIPVEVRRIEHGQTIDLDGVDLLFMGGGPDREQTLAAEQLMGMRDAIARYVEEGGPTLAICGGYQILGRTWLSSDGEVPGLGVLDIETRRAGSSTDRLIDNIALASPTAEHPVIGYENHASRTYLGPDVKPFGQVVSRTGHGNNDADHADGALYRNVLGTYLHGTLLAKNPEVADWLLERALARNAMRTGAPTPVLEPLNDAVELAANADIAAKLIHKGTEAEVRKKLEHVEREVRVAERKAERKAAHAIEEARTAERKAEEKIEHKASKGLRR